MRRRLGTKAGTGADTALCLLAFGDPQTLIKRCRRLRAGRRLQDTGNTAPCFLCQEHISEGACLRSPQLLSGNPRSMSCLTSFTAWETIQWKPVCPEPWVQILLVIPMGTVSHLKGLATLPTPFPYMSNGKGKGRGDRVVWRSLQAKCSQNTGSREGHNDLSQPASRGTSLFRRLAARQPLHSGVLA